MDRFLLALFVKNANADPITASKVIAPHSTFLNAIFIGFLLGSKYLLV